MTALERLLAEVEAEAKLASVTEWHINGADLGWIDYTGTIREIPREDKGFLQIASPKTVLALISIIRRQAEALEFYHQLAGWGQGSKTGVASYQMAKQAQHDVEAIAARAVR